MFRVHNNSIWSNIVRANSLLGIIACIASGLPNLARSHWACGEPVHIFKPLFEVQPIHAVM